MSVPAEVALRRLLDLEAIRDLACRYANCIWRKDADGAAALFADDGVMDTGDRPPLVGRDAIRDAYRAILPSSDLQPFVHNHVIDLDGDRATGSCNLDLRVTRDGTEPDRLGLLRRPLRPRRRRLELRRAPAHDAFPRAAPRRLGRGREEGSVMEVGPWLGSRRELD